MRAAPVSLLLLLACGGGPASKPEPAGPEASATPPGSPPAPATEAAPARPLPPDEPGLAEHWLVIVASKLDPAETDAPRAAAAAVPGTNARVVLSSRYKNLMPCYHVAIADGLADKAAALALSKTLSAAGVDNYVKNAGAYVGASAALDAFCARLGPGGAVEAGDTGQHRFLTVAGDRAFVPVDGEIPAALKLPDPAPLGEGFRAWIQPLPETGSQVRDPARTWTAVRVGTGEAKRCAETGLVVLTLGTPHFGVLQAPAPPSEPSCGAPALFAGLDCALEPGVWVAVADGSPAGWRQTDAGSEPQLAALKAELDRLPAWSSFSDPGGGPVQRTTSLARYAGPKGAVWVGQGAAESEMGICGGDALNLRAVWAAGEAGLGQRLGEWQESRFSELEGLVDVDGDGVPEIVWSEFPDTLHLSRLDGAELTTFEVAYCDCAC